MIISVSLIVISVIAVYTSLRKIKKQKHLDNWFWRFLIILSIIPLIIGALLFVREVLGVIG